MLRKSIGYSDNKVKKVKNPSFYKSKTFSPTLNQKTLNEIICNLSKELEKKCVKDKVQFKKLSLNIHFKDFTKISKGTTLPGYISSADSIIDKSLELLGTSHSLPIRLLGIKVFDFNKKVNMTIDKVIKNNEEENEKRRFSFRPDTPKKTVCPICLKDFDFKGNNSSLNRHIDLCLKN